MYRIRIEPLFMWIIRHYTKCKLIFYIVPAETFIILKDDDDFMITAVSVLLFQRSFHCYSLLLISATLPEMMLFHLFPAIKQHLEYEK